MRNLQETHLNRARASLRQALSWYGYLRKSGQLSSNPELLGLMKPELEALNSTLNKLDSNVIRIAAFGLVSRGKSAVLNALLGEKILQTGPLNGVTQWPRSVRWQPGGKVLVELIDTPGLDEIEGESRADMAREVVHQADLILFVVFLNTIVKIEVQKKEGDPKHVSQQHTLIGKQEQTRGKPNLTEYVNKLLATGKSKVK